MIKSALHFYSLGLAAENKRLDSNELNVLPMEAMNAFDGELRVNPQELHTKAVDGQGNSLQFKVLTDTVLTADWLPLDGNKLTAPDMRRGEEVEIWRLGDSDTYYWRSHATRLGQRTLETAIWAWAAQPDITDDKRNAENSYFLEISTHGKHVTFSTSQKNGEPFGYTLQFNTKDGKVVLEDQTGNTVYLDSAARVIRLLNSTKSEIAINDKDIYMRAVRDMKIDVGRDMEVNVGRDLKTKVGSNETREVGKVRQTKIGTNEEKKVGAVEQIEIGANRIDTVKGTYKETVVGAYTGVYNAARITTVSGVTTDTFTGGYTGTYSGIRNETVAGAYTLQSPIYNVTALATVQGEIVLNGVKHSQHKHPAPHGMTDKPQN